jgi:DNA-binding HxlR family transcriptional regulator
VDRRRPQRLSAPPPRARAAAGSGVQLPLGTLGALPAGLIARPWTIAILIELADRPCRPHELERRIAGVSHAVLMRRLTQLWRAGVIARSGGPRVSPRPHLMLTAAGRALNVLAELAELWETRTRLRTRALPGVWALRTLADEGTWQILRALSQQPLDAHELARRAGAAAGDGEPLRRLAEHMRDGLLAGRESGAGTVYELTADARRLVALALPAMAWELRFSRPAAERAASDLVTMLRLGAPLAVVPVELTGVCAIRVVPCGSAGSGLWLRARSGRLSALGSAPAGPAAAEGHASASGWLHALLENRRRAITTVGEEALLAGVLDALSALSDAPASTSEAPRAGVRL